MNGSARGDSRKDSFLLREAPCHGKGLLVSHLNDLVYDLSVEYAGHEACTYALNLVWTWYATGPGAGIQLQQGKYAGRLIIPCDHMRQKTGRSKYWSHVIYSDDHGRTWQIGGIAGDMNNECEAVELADGKLMLNMRNWAGGKNRVVAISENGGQSFGPSRHSSVRAES